MCGIVGYVGNKSAQPILINGLTNLEYRGYDSAGFATIENNKINVQKEVGRVKYLENISNKNISDSTIGIAHTRWATHGRASKENAHPHLDNSNSFAVVHNGIIENYIELKDFLSKEGYTFLSETDTEVIPNLIHYYYNQSNNFLKAVDFSCRKLKGSYSIAIMCKFEPKKIIVAKKDSPLVIGKGNNEFYISSDVAAVLSYTKDFYFIKDLELAEITRENISFFDFDLKPISKEIKRLDLDSNAAQKNGYEDYMLKEINEQPDAIRKTLQEENNEFDYSTIKSYNKIYIIACGTAMHAGLVGKKLFEELCRIPVEVDVASEFRYRNAIIDNKTLAIFISQSGETADTISALKLCKEKNAKTIAITNVIGSSITRQADYVFYTMAGPEIAVASTKAYTSQIALLAKMVINFAKELNYDSNKLKQIQEDLSKLPEQISQILRKTDHIKTIAKEIYSIKDAFYIGRGIDYCSSMEASLKIKEIAYVHSESYASGELKHGSIALIEDGIYVISIITDSELKDKSISNIQEVITRGAKSIVVTNQNIDKSIFTHIIEIPKTNTLLSPILSVIPLQLLAYYVAKEKGLDVDKPRNLAKSVTVE